MADLGSFTALVTAAGSVIGLANKANTVEANQKIIELQQRIAEVQQAFSELFQEIQNLKEENRKLKDEISAEASRGGSRPDAIHYCLGFHDGHAVD